MLQWFPPRPAPSPNRSKSLRVAALAASLCQQVGNKVGALAGVGHDCASLTGLLSLLQDRQQQPQTRAGRSATDCFFENCPSLNKVLDSRPLKRHRGDAAAAEGGMRVAGSANPAGVPEHAKVGMMLPHMQQRYHAWRILRVSLLWFDRCMHIWPGKRCHHCQVIC